MIIAIDGPAASGKGTIAPPNRRALPAASSRHRAALPRHRRRLDRGGPRSLRRSRGGRRRPRARVSPISTTRPCARAKWARRPRWSPRCRAFARALIEAQRAFAARPGGAVLDGRDIGTVICPDADVKIFVTASAAARAQRRALELLQRGEKADYQAILADIIRRDARDF